MWDIDKKESAWPSLSSLRPERVLDSYDGPRLFTVRCRLGDLKAKHQEFAMDPGRAPLLVFLAHPLNEIAQATIDLWPPCPLSGFPAPESFEARAMPAKDGLRLNHMGQAEQARPEPGHPYQQRTVTAAAVEDEAARAVTTEAPHWRSSRRGGIPEEPRPSGYAATVTLCLPRKASHFWRMLLVVSSTAEPEMISV
jgi:hypothetical protein